MNAFAGLVTRDYLDKRFAEFEAGFTWKIVGLVARGVQIVIFSLDHEVSVDPPGETSRTSSRRGSVPSRSGGGMRRPTLPTASRSPSGLTSW